MIKRLEDRAMHWQEAAGRAWAALLDAKWAGESPEVIASLQSDYDAAKKLQDDASDALKAAQ